ncbi:MAG: SLBB domain-containing protein [Gammaproteobacteria bacterium]|nr:SLBB domain-containing protein [Gammaproteobacteria bacterium]MBU1406951.1 SLBB domain-containing protein [Gammaproteobacteria bacterium]MBU1533094.1 SLBB domain-containing protein [Gammaproteobacteria bacterium]
MQQATGRSLPIYGQQLFNAPSGYVPVTQAPVPNNYIIGPGDEIRLQVWGSIDAEKSLTINRHGQINLPKVGVINLTGVRAGDLESVLRSKIGRVFTNFSLNATLGRLRSIQIYVVGQAQQPGTYTVSSLSTLINALFEVGGPGSTGSMRNVQLKRDGRIVGRMDLYDFIARGDRSGDVPLQPGDVIVIPPAGPRVAVLGAFEQPAIYELKGSDSVGEVLALGGGVSVLAKPGKALLERIDPAADTARRVEEFALDTAGLKKPLHDGDILTLFEISPQFANAVTLRGNVAEPLRYPYTDGMRIRDLIPDREALITPDYYKRKNLLVLFDKADKTDAADVELGVRKLLDEVNWDYAVIERLDRASLTTRLIPFNLARAVIDGDEQHNLALQPGDIVTILSKNDLRVPQERQTRLVRVEGEVAAPGIYQVEAGETLPQLLARLGGVTPNAYLYGAEFTRESVRKQQQSNLDTVIRKLESQLQAESGKKIADPQAQDEAQAQLLAQQQQLERMKAFKSNGRISLELPPAQVTLDALPPLPLEDGDAIRIPSRPGFVTAVGEVYNENAIIYRPGRTVGDVLATAGLSDNSEPGNAFVLRADGSVKAARSNDSLFRLGGFEDIELMPGDTVVVPAKLDRRTGWTKFVAGLKDWTQILYQFGLGVAAWKNLD